MTSASPPPPKFAADRALGRTAPGILRDHGWDVVLIQDIFPDDAKNVSDTEWIKWASSHVDGALTKDAAIRRQSSYSEARIPIFCLGNQKLGFEAMAALYLKHERTIWRVASLHAGRAFWQIYANGDIRKLDP